MKDEKYYVLENEHDGQGWYLPLGKIEMYKSEAEEFVVGQHYAYLADLHEFGNTYEEPTFKIIRVSEYVDPEEVKQMKPVEQVNKDGSITLTSRDGSYNVRYVVNNAGRFVDEWEQPEYDSNFDW